MEGHTAVAVEAAAGLLEVAPASSHDPSRREEGAADAFRWVEILVQDRHGEPDSPPAEEGSREVREGYYSQDDMESAGLRQEIWKALIHCLGARKPSLEDTQEVLDLEEDGEPPTAAAGEEDDDDEKEDKTGAEADRASGVRHLEAEVDAR